MKDRGNFNVMPAGQRFRKAVNTMISYPIIKLIHWTNLLTYSVPMAAQILPNPT